jgi:hypothetical protein
MCLISLGQVSQVGFLVLHTFLVFWKHIYATFPGSPPAYSTFNMVALCIATALRLVWPCLSTPVCEVGHQSPTSLGAEPWSQPHSCHLNTHL